VDRRFADDQGPHQSRHAAPFLALDALDAQRSGLFVWHCHILEHEDNKMMRPYRIRR